MIAALIVGGITAWFLGGRYGLVAGAVTAAALLVAAIVPGLALLVYALVIAWVAALYFFGAKISSTIGRDAGLSGRLVSIVARAIKGRGRRR